MAQIDTRFSVPGTLSTVEQAVWPWLKPKVAAFLWQYYDTHKNDKVTKLLGFITISIGSFGIVENLLTAVFGPESTSTVAPSGDPSVALPLNAPVQHQFGIMQNAFDNKTFTLSPLNGNTQQAVLRAPGLPAGAVRSGQKGQRYMLAPLSPDGTNFAGDVTQWFLGPVCGSELDQWLASPSATVTASPRGSDALIITLLKS